MDNLKSLFDKKEFGLIIDLTKDQYDYSSLSYRLNSFINLNKLEDALAILKDKRSNDVLYSNNAKAIIKIHFELLKELKREQELLDTYNDYINRPYISQEVEEVLREFNSFFNKEIKKEKTIDVYLDNLISSSNEEILLESLVNIKKLNFKEYSNDLIAFIKRKKVADHLKTFALFMLVDISINQEIEFVKNDETYKVNPSKLVNPFSKKEYQEIKKYLDSMCKNISISKTAFNIFNNYIIDIYPSYIEDKFDDLKLVSAAFLLEAKRRLSDKEDEEIFINSFGVDYRNTLDVIFNIHKDLKI